MNSALPFVLAVLAGTTNLPLSPTPPAETNTPASSPISDLKEISPGILEYHGVRLDKKNHRITFSGIINQREGAIEYLLVNDKGKTHESVISTKVMPHDIHLGLLLIGLKDAATANPRETAPPSAIDSAYLHAAPKLQGTSVLLSVAWTQDGKQKEIPAEDFIFNQQTNHPMTHGIWTYNGSMVQDGVFLADQELSVVALVTDPTALVNNPRDGYDNDEIWQPREEAIPPLDTPVEVTITLAEPSTKKP